MKRLLIVILAILVMAGAVFAQDAEPGAGETAKPAETKTEPVAKKKAKASLKIGGSVRFYFWYDKYSAKNTIADDAWQSGYMGAKAELRLKFKVKYSDWITGYGMIRVRERADDEVDLDESDDATTVHLKETLYLRLGRKKGLYLWTGIDILPFYVLAGDSLDNVTFSEEYWYQNNLNIRVGYNLGIVDIAFGFYRSTYDHEGAGYNNKFFQNILISASLNLGMFKAHVGFISNANDTEGAYSIGSGTDDAKKGHMAISAALMVDVAMFNIGVEFIMGLTSNESKQIDGDDQSPMTVAFQVVAKLMKMMKIGVQFNIATHLNKSMEIGFFTNFKFGKFDTGFEVQYSTYNKDFSASNEDKTHFNFLIRNRVKF